MEELLKALTRAANAVAVYYEKQAHPLLPLGDAPASVPASEPAPRTRKPRAPKIEAEIAPPAAPVKPASELSEAESTAKIKATAKTYVQRFANQVDGIAAFRKLMVDTCRVGKLDDLVHAQRLQVISAAEADIAKGTTAPAPKPAAASVEV